MNIYSQKQKIKFGLFVIAVIISAGAVWYSSDLTKQLSEEERNKVQLWAETMREIQLIELGEDVSPTLSKIIQDNKTIPVILADEKDNIITHMNMHPRKSKDEAFLKDELLHMKEAGDTIVVHFGKGKTNVVYFKESILLTNLFYYPFILISVVALFIFVSYMAFRSSRKSEENQLWVGMSKETAHQLGTPISSLIAWIELLKLKNGNPELISEVEKDVKRLETITERFSKIGSTPELVPHELNNVLESAVGYLKARTSRKVVYNLGFLHNDEVNVPLNLPLFEWVIENLCKNAIDAMSGKGTITMTFEEKNTHVILDIEDTGKGIPKGSQKTVFKPGFTTKKRGWGLGLSLAKRIIETYHSGKIFVKHSEVNKGTTFRLILKKSTMKKL